MHRSAKAELHATTIKKFVNPTLQSHFFYLNGVFQEDNAAPHCFQSLSNLHAKMQNLGYAHLESLHDHQVSQSLNLILPHNYYKKLIEKYD
ncbi:hypothetical protein G9A89_016870 [Geosiphon pyriformis]|nr:hypothetical protein G9A89_016870 [Geosiphon pyriformis]